MLGRFACYAKARLMGEAQTSRNLPKRRWHMLSLALLTLFMLLPGLASLPVIDRDEARYAQASVQMAESGDLLNIRFQDEARNKKPAGAYWAQTAMLKSLSSPDKRRIWVQRLPSVIASLLSVWLTYLGAVRLIGRQSAVFAAGALALSLIFVFEGHIAKTDAMLCAAACALFASFAHIRHPAKTARFPRAWIWVFWIALGAGIMIKGPIVPALAIITLLGLWAWERRIDWARPLLFWPAIIVFILMWLPWAVAIYFATDGAFFAESLGKDFGGKLVTAQEKHPGPPGYHLGLIWLTLWPSCLFLIPGLTYAVLAVRRGRGNQSALQDHLPKAMRLCLVWIVPFWLMIEIMPTKLPHYILPLFPALCVMIGAGIATLLQVKAFGKSRFFSGLLYLIAGTALCAALLYASIRFGNDAMEIPTYAIIGAGGLMIFIASFALWAGAARTAVITSALSGVILSVGAYGYILPNLQALRVSERIAQTLPPQNYSEVLSVSFTEPSLLYHTDKSLRLGGQGDPLDMDALRAGRILLLDKERDEDVAILDQLKARTAETQLCLQERNPVSGFNYSKGDPVEIVQITAIPCPAIATDPEQPSEE